MAAGIQNKVLVAMGCGLPVITTDLIAQAIPELQNEQNVLIRDEAATIAEACLSIMHNPQRRLQLSQRGYQVVQLNYSWREKIKGYVR